MNQPPAALRVALISIGHCPSLATRNIRCYCLAHEDVRTRATFTLVDLDIRKFFKSQVKSIHRYTFITAADETLASLLELRPAIVGFSCYLWNSEVSIRLASQIKRILPETQIVLGGPDVGPPRASALLETHPELDVIIEEDGEVPFLELVRRHLAGEPSNLDGVPQATYRRAGTIARSAAPAGATDLSLLRGVFDDAPTPEELGRWGWPYIPYETMRGCPYHCSFCMYGRIPVNARDVKVVVEELAALRSRGLDLEVIDATFTTYAKRAKEILRGLAEHRHETRLLISAYPDSIDEELVELFKKTNVTKLNIGFQTVSDDGLKAISRPKNLARFERAVRLLGDGGIPFYVDIIYGLPKTTVEDFVAGMDYLCAQGAPNIQAYRLLGLPGSPMMRDVDTDGLVFSSTPPYEMLSSLSFSLEDIIFCESFARAYYWLYERVGGQLLAKFARMAGGLSALVRFVMRSEVFPNGDVDQLNRILARVMKGELDDIEPVAHEPYARIWRNLLGGIRSNPASELIEERLIQIL